MASLRKNFVNWKMEHENSLVTLSQLFALRLSITMRGLINCFWRGSVNRNYSSKNKNLHLKIMMLKPKKFLNYNLYYSKIDNWLVFIVTFSMFFKLKFTI